MDRYQDKYKTCNSIVGKPFSTVEAAISSYLYSIKAYIPSMQAELKIFREEDLNNLNKKKIALGLKVYKASQNL